MSLRERLSDPCFWIKVHGVAALIWVVLMPPSVLWWRDSVPYLVMLSVYANFAGSVASWTAAKGDRNSVDVADLERVERKIDALRRLVK